MINPIYYLYRIAPTEQKIISENFRFYRNLSAYEKRKFEYRVQHFINHHNFVGRENLVITLEKKTIIASIAVMLTFKLSNYLYKQIDNIIVYPKNYLSHITKKMHRGETNPRVKTIVFSWEGLVDGITVEDDNVNLGIHEFTHALYFSFLNDDRDEAKWFIANFEEVLYFLENKTLLIHLKTDNYFRKYAFKNKYEFLAVITENYFETPEMFRKKFPKLFELMNRLYRIY